MNIRKKIKKTSFTLIEILVAIFIISLTASLMSIKLVKFLKEHRLKVSKQRAEGYLLYVRYMAIIHDTDTFITIKKKKNGLVFKMGTDEKIGFLPQQKREKAYISSLKFFYNGEEVEEMTFCYSSSGERIEKGTINFELFSIEQGL